MKNSTDVVEGELIQAEKVPGQVTLSKPINVGGQEISSVVLREPNSGELRGMNLMDLLQMNVGALIKVVPRISSPFLSESVITALPPRDLMALGLELTGFLVDTDPSQTP